MITLAGLPLLMPDSDGELFRWQEAFQAARQYDLFAEPAADKSSRYGSRAESGGVGLPVPNYPEPPDPRINQIYWPTGATRWARGYFLANEPAATGIIAKSGNYSTALDLKISNSSSPELTIKVYLLPPRPVTVSTTPAVSSDINTKQLWLIPVVDERYFWNHGESGDLNPDEFETWSWKELYNYLLNAAGAHADNQDKFDPAEEFLEPDKTEFKRRYDNVAALIDACVLSCGHRLYTSFNGRHWPDRPTQSASSVTTRNNHLKTLVAGGFQKTPFTPANTVLVFNKFKHGRRLESEEKYTKTYASSNLSAAKKSGTYRTIHSSLLADYSTGSIANQTKCDDLAFALESYLTDWDKYQYDLTFAGVVVEQNGMAGYELGPCSYDDSILITFGAQRYNSGTGEYEYEASTRIKSYPLNFGVESQLSQDPYLRIVSHFQDAIPAEDVDAGTSGNFYFFDETGTALIKDENDDPYPFEVHNEWGPDLKEDPLTGTGANYDRVRVHWQEESERWEVVKIKNLPRRGKTSGAITTGSGTVQAYDGSSLITDYTVSVTSALGDVADDKWVIYDWINGQWEIVSAECE